MSKNTLKDITLISLLTIFSTLLVWAPFIFRLRSFWGLSYPGDGMITIWRNFDGLNYIAVAKSLYNPQILADEFSGLGLSPIYFASHFPLYPLFVSLFASLFGFLNSMLFVTVLFSMAAAIMFYLLVRDFKLTSSPFFLTFVFLLLPARWLVVRNVGSPEPIFIFLILASFYALRKNLFLITGIASALAILTRSPAVILWGAITSSIVAPWLLTRFRIQFTLPHKIQGLSLVSIGLAPLAALGLFWFYQIQYGDFLAYFHSGDNIHLTFPIFPVFNVKQFWVGTFWLENIIYVYLFMAGATLILWRKKLYDMALFVGLYFLASSFVAHLDIGRYTLPTFPLVLIAFEKWITTREFKIILLILLIPIYLFTQNFLLGNTAPIADFTPFK